MVERYFDTIKYLTFESLDQFQDITNIFTTRIGGVSKGYHSSMNLGFSNGDDSSCVTENFHIISKVLGISPDHIVRSMQTHTTNVVKVTANDCGNDGELVPNRFTDVDGLMTNEPGIALACFYADCVPLYFYDPRLKVVAVAHSGWRGTVGRMGAVTINRMAEEYGSDPADIYTAIGPSICKECYEVSEDVAYAFKKEFGEVSDSFISPGKCEGKYQLDLWKANKVILRDAGIREEHIECAELCTCCNSEWLFSHRASGGKRGNLGAFIMLR